MKLIRLLIGILIFTALAFNALAQLEITNLDVKIDSKTDSNILNGETINKEANPGSAVTLKLKVKNNSTAMDIDNIEIKATLKGIDDDEDIEEEGKGFDLKKSGSKSESIKLDIPYRVDEGTYDLEIYIEGEDEDGNVNEVDWKLRLVVEKDRHKIIIYKADLGSEALSCARTTNLNLELMNIGKEEEDNVKVVVSSPELGVDFNEEYIELSEDINEDGYEKTIRIQLDESFKSGIYPILVEAYREGKLEDSKELSLSVDGCEIAAEPKQEKNEIEINKIPMKLATTTAEEEIEIGAMAALGVGIIGVLILIIVSLYFGFRKR